MAVRAAVLPAVGAPLEVTEIVLPDPGPGQVRVRLSAAGVCHSDLSLSDGTMRVPVPAVLGHEGAGTVVAVGEGVTAVAPGDPVVLFGPGVHGEPTAQDWADACGTISYEIVTRMGGRLARRYVDAGAEVAGLTTGAGGR